MATPRVSNRYPRRGECLAPSTLREFLLQPLPQQFRGGSPDVQLTLADLDERAWQQFSEETLVEVSKQIVGRVAQCHVRKSFQDRHFPRPAAGLRLEDLRLENRTRRCLVRAGFDENLGKLACCDCGTGCKVSMTKLLGRTPGCGCCRV